MNSKTTGIWFVIATALIAFIFVFEHYLRPVTAGPAPLLPGLLPSAVTRVQVFPSGAHEISADRANVGWILKKPVIYPAQAAAIGALLDALQKLSPYKISAGELHESKNLDADFGFENPQATLVITAGEQSWQLKAGNRTAPGDQVYLRLVGVDGAFVADAGWLKLIPRAADEWRDTALVNNAGQNDFDWIVLTNNAKVIELRRDPTNRLWHMIRPLQARADADRIGDALQRLATARVAQFITDEPKADLSVFGLQPADLDLWLGRGTNLTATVHLGKSPTNDATQVYARREELNSVITNWNSVVTTAREPLAPWRGAVNDFRDTRLLELTAPVAEIEIRADNNFILRQQSSNDWRIVGETFPADADNVQLFIKTLAGLRITDFVKEAVTKSALEEYGLTTPQREIILRSKAGDTNAVIAQLDFGATQTNEVFVRSAGEDSIYAVAAQDFNRLQESGWEFRDRRIWDFKPEDVAQITIHQGGRTRQIVHNGPGKWSLASGSQGIIEGKSIDQAVQQLRQLTALAWFSPNLTEPEKYGFGTNNLQITVELKGGQKNTVDFGGEFARGQTALAAVTLDGGRWAFLFPPVPYQFVLSFLTIPENTP